MKTVSRPAPAVAARKSSTPNKPYPSIHNFGSEVNLALTHASQWTRTNYPRALDVQAQLEQSPIWQHLRDEITKLRHNEEAQESKFLFAAGFLYLAGEMAGAKRAEDALRGAQTTALVQAAERFVQ